MHKSPFFSKFVYEPIYTTMKTYLRYLLAFVLAMQASFIFATGQEADVIYIDGTEWKLYAHPLEMDSVIQQKLKSILPDNKDRSWRTSNWKGYTAHWNLDEGMLYLQYIRVHMYDKGAKRSYTKYILPDDMKEAFPAHVTKFGLEARWFNGEVRVGKGELIRYEHSWFNRNVEQEQIMTFENGKLKSQSPVYHNKVLLKRDENKLSETVHYAFSPTMKKDDVFKNSYKRLLMRNIEFTPGGYFKDCELQLNIHHPRTEQLQAKPIQIKDQQHEYIKELKEILRTRFVQNRYYINGRYQEEDRVDFDFSF